MVVRANGLEFGLLEAGSGPLALCLHGFPDSAHTWRHLLPALAGAGFHAVAPFLRGYAPTAGAAASAPERWRRVVTLGGPPPGLDPLLFGDYQQLKRFFYLFLFRDSLARAVEVVAADGMAFLDRLWQDWSPGYDAAEAIARAKESLRQPANLAAAIGYYRDPAVGAPPRRRAGRPTLYLHGGADGCIGADLVGGAERLLPSGSRMTLVQGAGHFPHLEKPEEVNGHILSWVTG